MIKKPHLILYVLIVFLIFSCNKKGEDIVEEELNIETYILVNTTSDDGSFIINQEGEEIYNFDLSTVGNDVNLQNDGSLIGMGRTSNAEITFGGYGGTIFKQNADKSTAWTIEYSSSDFVCHHDVEYLPNGNILFLVWEKIDNSAALNIGFSGSSDIFPDAVIEMNPLTQEVIWEWHVMDHLIQDFDATKPNFGVVSDNPNKININYNSNISNGDITHANGLTYDSINDLIYLTVNNYSEIWVIDHSTSKNETKTSSGGNYNLGGDLIYRFGNPATYNNQNNSNETVLDRVHYPNLLDSGNLLVYSNQATKGQSEAVEYKLPTPLSLTANTNNEPETVWNFTDTNLFSRIASSGVRMKNGNTLIAEATTGTLWEITNEGEIQWKLKVSDETIWRAYVYYSNDPAIKALDIE